MIKFFEKGDKKQIKLVLEEVYKVKDIDKMSDNELVFCYIAKTLKSLEDFCEIVESTETETDAEVEMLKKELEFLKNETAKMKCALKQARSFNEFKSFVDGDFFC